MEICVLKPNSIAGFSLFSIDGIHIGTALIVAFQEIITWINLFQIVFRHAFHTQSLTKYTMNIYSRNVPALKMAANSPKSIALNPSESKSELIFIPTYQPAWFNRTYHVTHSTIIEC